jgi:SAM-dependent methyltransferase
MATASIRRSTTSCSTSTPSCAAAKTKGSWRRSARSTPIATFAFSTWAAAPAPSCGYAADISRKCTRAKVWTGDILELPLPEGSFDVINATEVIEHLRDPLAFFHRVRSLLRPGGVFIYSTGNARGIYARLLGRRWPYLHPEGHLFYYTPETLASYFERARLHCLDVRALDRSTRKALMSADDRIAHSQLLYIGQGERGLKGWISRAIAAAETPAVMRAWSLLFGKYRLPIAVNSLSK